MSLSESVFDYRTIYGRTYQVSSTTEYWCPNDEVQNRGLDIAHHFITMLLGGNLFEAPLPRMALSRVLDIGTGTGIWAIDMADDYPAAVVIGTDISPIQPSWVPPNCSFQLEDAQLEWTFAPANFAFVHLRALNGCIRDWPALYGQAHNVLKPGGWIEHLEFAVRLYSTVPEISNDPCHIFRQWADVLIEAGDRMGKSLRIGMDGSIERQMRNSGFVNITSKTYHVPVGGWSSNPIYREIGLYNLAFMTESLEGCALFLLREYMGWERARIEVFIAEMRRAVRSSSERPYCVVYV